MEFESIIAAPGWKDAAMPIRVGSMGMPAGVLMRVLEEIDHALLLVDAEGRVRYANQLGLHELSAGAALQLAEGRVRARQPGDQIALRQGLADAEQGRRRLFGVGNGATAVSIAAVPVPGDDDDAASLVLLVFGKRRSAQTTLTMDIYARSQGLTAAEMSVLKELCSGMKPKEIAREQGVAISTVRSHICSIRAKTRTGSIRDLVSSVSVLPPITPVVKTMTRAVAVH